MVNIWKHDRLNDLFTSHLWLRFNTKLGHIMDMLDEKYEDYKMEKKNLNFVLLLERLDLDYPTNNTIFE